MAKSMKNGSSLITLNPVESSADALLPSKNRDSLVAWFELYMETKLARQKRTHSALRRAISRSSSNISWTVRGPRMVKKLSRTQNAAKHSVSRRWIVAFVCLDFICRDRKLPHFGAEHVLSAPTLALTAHRTLGPCEPTAATGH